MNRSNCRREPFSLEDPPRPIGDGHFDDVLCQIDRHRHSIPLGLLLVCGATHQLAAIMPRKNRRTVH